MKIGRKVALGLYVSLLSYLIVAAFVSVTSQVFWPERSAATSDKTNEKRLDCNAELQELYVQLNHRSAREISQPTNKTLRNSEFFDHWDDRYERIASICRSATSDALHKYRHRTQLTLQRHDREEAKLARQVETLLKSDF